jgi:hypothetical protein
VMAEPIRQSRAFARRAAKTLVPKSRVGVWGLAAGAQAFSLMPARVGRAIAASKPVGLGLYDTMPVGNY